MPKSSTEKMRMYRDRLRAQGLRPVQLWIPDTRNPRVRERLRRQVRAVFRHPATHAIDRRLDAALKDIEGWTA